MNKTFKHKSTASAGMGDQQL